MIDQQKKRIQAILGDSKDCWEGWEGLSEWMNYLHKNIQFPFEAILSEGKAIQEFLDMMNANNVINAVDEDELNAIIENLGLPSVEISENQDPELLYTGDNVTVSHIDEMDLSYSIVITASRQHSQYELPLCYLEVLDKSSPNYQIINDYTAWFFNFRVPISLKNFSL